MEPVLSLGLAGLVPGTFEPTPDSEIWNKDISFACGGFWKLEGPSGSGKTSLVSYLAGARRDYSGSITFYANSGSIDLATCTSREWSSIRCRHLSFVFQDLRLIDHLSLQENLLIKSGLAADTYQMGHPDYIRELCTIVEIDNYLNKPARLLSRGELQRAAIVRSLLQPFDWIVLDEAFSHLDYRLKRIVADLIIHECQTRSAGGLVLDLQPDELLPYQATLQFGRSL